MANKSAPVGFFYDVRYGDESPPIHHFEMATGTTLNIGDPVTFTNGYLTLAATGDFVLGVVIGKSAEDGGVYDNAGPIVAGAGAPKVAIILAFADTVFRVHDANAAPTIALRGESCDMVGGTGAVGVNSGTVTNGDVMLFDVAGPENIGGNVVGADMDWLGIFQKRYIL